MELPWPFPVFPSVPFPFPFPLLELVLVGSPVVVVEAFFPFPCASSALARFTQRVARAGGTKTAVFASRIRKARRVS